MPRGSIDVEAPHRGCFICFHGEEAPPITDAELWEVFDVLEPMLSCYLEVARRLPLTEMPGLLGCIRDGGLCIGLLDPIGNIILNSVHLYFHRFYAGDRDRRARTMLTSPEEESTYYPFDKYTYWAIALRSHAGLVVFMQSYFRYLSEAQARRYIHLAGHDLALAVVLAQLRLGH